MRRLSPSFSLVVLALASAALAEPRAATIPRFDLPTSGLELRREIRSGAFFDVVGRRSALLGYENRGFEAWVYPLKLLDDFRLAFRIEGYPLPFEALDLATSIVVRPEATVVTYSHAAFTVEQVLFAPVDEPGLVMLLEIRSVLPLTVIGSFRPRLKLMWPAGLMTANASWDEKAHVYTLTEESKRFVAVIGSPAAQDLSVMPYQEEPRDVPLRFEITLKDPGTLSGFVPILMAGAVDGKEKALATYERLLGSVRDLYAGNVAHYRELQERTTRIATPDARLDTAFAWAKVGIDKGLAENPLLGRGLLAGFRTSGESERPGFAWLFGRDALWTSLALDAYGDFDTARTALDFLKKHQRADGKIPHEVSQSASLIPWFTDYPFPWNSADATPLYVVAQADRYRATGDLEYVRASWDSIVRAWRFTAATDTDGNGLVENTKFGHGWVEGGALYPPHEEIYLQGTWIEAGRGLAEMADALGERTLAAEARAWAERTRVATEKTYWLADRGFYGFATQLPADRPKEAEPGPARAVRQARLDALRAARFIDEDTVLPAVPLWWGLLDPQRAALEIDHLGASALATDWGTRLLSNRSRLYDPLSYHYGSVWPLFTGWSAMAAYRYGRPQVGFQAVMANALLTFEGALGYVTELLSGDFDAPFGRSSHHQIWSQAMVAAPLIRGLLGISVDQGGRRLRFAPQLPADWPRVEVRGVVAGPGHFDLTLAREAGRTTITATRDAAGAGVRLQLAAALPLDARIRSATVDGREVGVDRTVVGDVQRGEVEVTAPGATATATFEYDEGTDVSLDYEPPAGGARNHGLRVLRSRAEGGTLRLALEGLAGRSYTLKVRSPRRISGVPGVDVEPGPDREARLRVRFDGPADTYVRRELALPLQ
jgi:glycogen debranching enzyme